MHLGFLTILLVVSMQTSSANFQSFGQINRQMFEFHDPSNSLDFREAEDGLSKVGITEKSKVKNGRCNKRMDVDVDDFYRVEYPTRKKCSMKFEAKPGVTITVFCSNIKLGSCNTEFLFVSANSNSHVFCGSKTPRKAENLNEIYVQYERATTRKVFNSVLRCYVSGSEKSMMKDKKFQSTGVKGWQICPESCGRQKAGSTGFRIIGGESARKGQHPWIVHLRIRNNANKQYLCGGSILNSRTIITAAHCITENKARVIFATIGAHNLDNKREITQVLNIKNWVIHPRYNANKQIHDIALLKTSTPIRFRSNVAPMCLDSGKNYMDRMATAVGWGYINLAQKISSPVLQEVKLRVWDHKRCQRNYKRIEKEIIDEQICANELGKDTCQGDSGGPLTVKDNGYTYQIGVLSYGHGCANYKFPGVYARVSKYKQWIKDNLRDGTCK